MHAIECTPPSYIDAEAVQRFEDRHPSHRYALIHEEVKFGYRWSHVWTGMRFELAAPGHHLMRFTRAVAELRAHGGQLVMIRVEDDHGLPCCYREAVVVFRHGAPCVVSSEAEAA